MSQSADQPDHKQKWITVPITGVDPQNTVLTFNWINTHCDANGSSLSLCSRGFCGYCHGLIFYSITFKYLVIKENVTVTDDSVLLYIQGGRWLPVCLDIIRSLWRLEEICPT